MTLSSSLATVADSIAGLSISGLTIKDIDQIPDNASMLCPIMFPQPDGFVTNLHTERVTFGSNGAEKMDLTYSLNYVMLFAEVGSGFGTYSIFSGLVTKIVAVVNSLMNNDAITGAVDIVVGDVPGLGVVEDPAGNQYWGALLSFNVTEFLQS